MEPWKPGVLRAQSPPPRFIGNVRTHLVLGRVVAGFCEPRKQAAGQNKVARAPVSKWGIPLVMVGFALTWSYVRPVGSENAPRL